MSQALLRFLSLGEVWVGVLGLAAFLALFWVLRGTPVGQAVRPEEDEEAPRGGYRDRVVAAVTVGLLLILAGAYLAVTRGIAWSIPAFLLGFGTVFSLVLINQRYRHGSPTLRRTVDLSTAALNASLFAGVLVVVNVIAFRYGGRALDMTRERSYSLSSLTVNQLRSLKRPVTFTMFFGRGGVAVQERDRVSQLLDTFKAANPEVVRVDSVDPFRDLARYDALVKRVPAVDVTPGGGVVVEYGEGETSDREVVRNTDLFELPRQAPFDPEAQRFESVFTGEDALITALMRLREGTKPRVVFTAGHGEPSLDDTEPTRPGLGLWKSRLTATGSEVSAVNLLTQDIPDGTSVVIVAGPRTPFKPEEVARLKAFAGRKGPVLVLASDAEATGLEDFLKEFQVEPGKGVIIEPRLFLRGNPTAVLVPVVNPRHPIVDPLRNELVYLPRSAPLKVSTAPMKPLPDGSTPAPAVLLRTSAQSWVEPDLKTTRAQKDPTDEAGPATVAAAVADRPPSGDPRPGAPRLVVISCGYAGENAVVMQSPANLDLLMNAVNWLRGKAELLGIPPKTHVALTLNADPVVRARLILVPTVMAVLLIITLGVTTYLARRD
jgi:hypothetical protein